MSTYEHIWFTPRLNSNNELPHQKRFHCAGLSLIIDRFDSDGEFLSQETLTNFNVTTTFLNQTVLNRIKLCNIKYTTLAMQPLILSTIAIFMKNMKGCNDMFNSIISKKRETVKSISN